MAPKNYRYRYLKAVVRQVGCLASQESGSCQPHCPIRSPRIQFWQQTNKKPWQTASNQLINHLSINQSALNYWNNLVALPADLSGYQENSWMSSRVMVRSRCRPLQTKCLRRQRRQVSPPRSWIKIWNDWTWFYQSQQQTNLEAV